MRWRSTAWTSAAHSAMTAGGVMLPCHQKIVSSPDASWDGMKPSSTNGRMPSDSNRSCTWST